MRTVTNEKKSLLDTLDHLEHIVIKVTSVTGKNKTLSFPDFHKISEGLFLSAWTHWEEFLREIIIIDLATDPEGFLRKDIKKFRVKGASMRYAQKLLNHPDAPKNWVEWDYGKVFQRAEEFLGSGHRYPRTLPRHNDIEKLKRIRNGIAHHSDNAWESFKKLVQEPPFNFTPRQLRGITVGRFLLAHHWNGNTVIQESLQVIRDSANSLV